MQEENSIITRRWQTVTLLTEYTLLVQKKEEGENLWCEVLSGIRWIGHSHGCAGTCIVMDLYTKYVVISSPSSLM